MTLDTIVAIQALQADDAARIADHLLRLSVEDRSLRFSASLVTDETVRRYVAGMRFGHDEVYGLVDRQGRVVGLAHGCVFDSAAGLQVEAAFSIDADWRGRGLGHRLMQTIDEAAARRRAQAVVGVCAARNLPMRRIFERAGMALTREDDEMQARRALAGLAPAAELPVRSGRSGKLAARG